MLVHRTGETCVELLQPMPNVIAYEEVITRERTVSLISHGGVAGKRIELKPRRQRFEYLLLSHRTAGGSVLDGCLSKWIFEWEFRGLLFQRRSSYSDYRLFATKAKIIPIAP
jgi:hypothetical protein